MKLKRSVFLTLGILLLTSIACTSGEAKKENSSGEAGTVKVGDTCKELDAMSSKMVCVDNKLLFCSSYSQYKYIIQHNCSAKHVCFVDPSGKSGGCEPR